MAGHAAPGFKQLLAPGSVSARLAGQPRLDGVLPEEGGDGLDFVVLQAEARHLGGGPPGVRVLEPDGNPPGLQLYANFFEVGADFLDFPEQVAGAALELVGLGVEVAGPDAEVFSALVEPLGFLVGFGAVTGLDAAFGFEL